MIYRFLMPTSSPCRLLRQIQSIQCRDGCWKQRTGRLRMVSVVEYQRAYNILNCLTWTCGFVAGMPMESVSNSSTGVYTGSFSMDYVLQLARDPEYGPAYTTLGFGLSLLANRLSWFFNLKGPSIGLDSACSSTAMATDIACQALRNGSCDMVKRSPELF